MSKHHKKKNAGNNPAGFPQDNQPMVNNEVPIENEEQQMDAETSVGAEGVEVEIPSASETSMTEDGSESVEDAISQEGQDVVERAAGIVAEELSAGRTGCKEGSETPKATAFRGKIYEDSVSLYDDEARVAFDYFRQAAEKIVAEEDENTARQAKANEVIESVKKELKAADTEYAAAMNDKKKAKLWFIGFFLIIPIFVAITKLLKANKRIAAVEAAQKEAKDKQVEAERGLEELKKQFEAIKRDYTISKLGVAYVPIATEVPFEDKSFILDDTKSTANSTFDLYQVKAQDEFVSTLTSIKERESVVPVAETGVTPESIPAKELVPSFDSVWMNDYLGGMDRDLRAIAYFLRDLKETSVTLPVIQPQGEYAKFLDEYCTPDTGDMPVLDVFDNSSYSEDLRRFEEMNEMKKKLTFSGENLDDVLQKFISEIAENVQYVGRAKIASIGKVLSVCGETLLNSFKASYNNYSPEMAKDEIERLQNEDFSFRSNDATGIKPFILSIGSRVRYDVVSGNWVADDGARVSAPLGVHQIQEEIISPMVQNLLRETRVERLRIVNNIVDQKMNYVKEWQKEVDDFYGRGRAEGNDIINQIQVVLGEFTTAYSQYEAFRQTERAVAAGDENAPQNMKLAEGSSEKQVIAFKEQADQIEAQKNAFNDYVERLQGDIEVRAGTFSYTEDHEASLRDRHAKEAVMSLLAVDKLDDRRKVLLSANPYIAENAKLPPEATVNDEELYGRLGKDLRGVASSLVDAIDSELSEENSAEKLGTDGTKSAEVAEANESAENAVGSGCATGESDGNSDESVDSGVSSDDKEVSSVHGESSDVSESSDTDDESTPDASSDVTEAEAASEGVFADESNVEKSSEDETADPSDENKEEV